MAYGAPAAAPGSWLVRIAMRAQLILNHEPSWFAEFTSGLGVVGWSALALLTDDYAVTGWAAVQPCLGLLFGCWRVATLIRVFVKLELNLMARVLFSGIGFVWWLWLTALLIQHSGPLPGEGPFAAWAIAEVLTVLKFSMLVAQEQRRGGG